MYAKMLTTARRYLVSFETRDERDEMLSKLADLNGGREMQDYGLSNLYFIPKQQMCARRDGSYEADFSIDYQIEIRYFFSVNDVTNMQHIENKIYEMIFSEQLES